ncbi:tail fiber protein, partial [Dickeya dianthicola]
PETYKPQLQEGSGRVQTVRMILIVSSTDAVTLKIDPSVVLATRAYTDGKAAEAKAYTDAQTGGAKIEVKAYTDNMLTAHLAAANPHPQYAVSADVAVAMKAKLDVADVVGIPLPWPQAVAPSGWLKCNGQAFDKALYPKLATAYPSGVLPDLRGEFIRGWDDGRGVDSGRGLLSAQRATLLRTAMIDYAGTDLDNSSVLNGLAYAEADGSTKSIYPASAIYAPNGDNLSNTAAADNAVSGTSSFAAFQTGVTPPNWISVRSRNVAFNYIVRAA